MAPLGCIPAVKSGNPEVGGKCLTEPLTLARLHNRALAIALKKLENHLPGFKFSIFDYYNALGDRVNNPSKFGRLYHSLHSIWFWLALLIVGS